MRGQCRCCGARAWVDAAEVKDVPVAFIVNDRSQVAVIMNPLADDFLKVLELVVSGRYDPKLFREAKPTLDAATEARIAQWPNRAIFNQSRN